MTKRDNDFTEIPNARHNALDLPMARNLLAGCATLMLAAQVIDGNTSLDHFMAAFPILGAGYMYLHHRNHKKLQIQELQFVRENGDLQEIVNIEKINAKQNDTARTYMKQLALGAGLAVGASIVAATCDVSSVYQAVAGTLVFSGAWLAARRSRTKITEIVWERIDLVNEVKGGNATQKIDEWLNQRRAQLHSVPVQSTDTTDIEKVRVEKKRVSI